MREIDRKRREGDGRKEGGMEGWREGGSLGGVREEEEERKRNIDREREGKEGETERERDTEKGMPGEMWSGGIDGTEGDEEDGW